MTTVTTVETVAEFVASQVVVPTWMQDKVDEAVRRHGDNAEVVVTRMWTPFGSYVKDIDPVL